MEYYAKSATKSLSDDEKSEIVKKIKSAIEIVEDNLTQSAVSYTHLTLPTKWSV